MQQFTENLLAGIQITDIIDILLVAYLIYKLLGFIRESRAESLFKGILLLLIVAFVAGLLHLHTISWILKGTLAVGVLALIILFQPELRRALEHMGSGRIFKVNARVMDKDKAKAVVAAFVRAVENMAASRTGALIVFEQETSLVDICATGTELDAEVSTPMIENLFYKGSPLHDGALIVYQDKLKAAGCVLPLSENLALPQTLGTRHRAAIGITEQSDSLAVVVSEETGIVTVVYGGQMERYLDEKTLEKKLLALYLDDLQETSRVKSLFRRDEKEKD